MDQEIETDDLEAIPHLPDESECSSSAIDNETQTGTTHEHYSPGGGGQRRKKILAAVVSIVVVAAIAIGVALSVKPKQTAPPDSAGVVQNKNQDVVVVNLGDMSDEPEADAPSPANEEAPVVNEPPYESSGDVAVEEPSEVNIPEQEPLDDESETTSELPSNETPVAEEAESTNALPTIETPTDEVSESTSGLPSSETLIKPIEIPGTVTGTESVVQEIFDNDFLDISIEQVSDSEYPDDLIFEAGYEQQGPSENLNVEETVHETTEEKVEVTNSEDSSIPTVDYNGPVTDFIVTTEMSRITTSGICQNANEGVWRMSLKTDNYPWESSWQLIDNDGKEIASGPPKGKNYQRATRYIGQLCVKRGRYTMKFADRNGDGLCCKYGDGKVMVWVNGKNVVEIADQDYRDLEYPLIIRSENNEPTTPPPVTPRPTKAPTKAPTKKPNLRPTKAPTRKPSPTLNPAQLYTVEVTLATDRFAFETGFKLEALPSGTVIMQKTKGELENAKTYTFSELVEAGRYRLTIEDTFQGIQGDIREFYYSVSVNGEVVVFGNTFPDPTQEHVIRVGYTPPMTEREKEWLDAHNKRRQAYQDGVGGPGTFQPLVWSTDLAAEASRWVDEILPACKIVREPGLVPGENMSARNGIGDDRDEGPEVILNRWVDSKVNKPYPWNNSMTQVYWMATRYVGCSEKVQTMANGQFCYSTVCRYSRAGNCAMGQYSGWEEAVMTPRTQCGPSCNTCY